MHKLPAKRKQLIKTLLIYVVMTLAVITIVTFIFFFVLGYRFNVDDGRIEQYAFLQFDSKPTGAIVAVDGQAVNSKTPNKLAVREGQHDVVISKDGYQSWHKTVNVKAGTITWLSYGLLMPVSTNIESLANYVSVYSTLTAPKGNNMLVQEQANVPTFDLIDLNSDTIKSTKLTIPVNIYSQSGVAGLDHTFKVIKWDDGGRYVLVYHTYGVNNEWLVMDTKDVAATKNITRLLSVSISSINFSGTSGNDFYALNSGDIRKLDLSAGTMSKPLVSNVSSFDVYNSNIITYVGIDVSGTGNQTVGIYREGDSNQHILRTATSVDSVLRIATAHYYNDNYIAISDGKKVDILNGNYPNTVADNLTSMKLFASFSTTEDISTLSFSPTGEYVLVQSGSYFASYDLEHKNFVSSSIDGAGEVSQLKWLDDCYLWSDRDGKLVIREFDGANAHNLGNVAVGQDVSLVSSGKYLYSIDKTSTGYQLQRIQMTNK